MLHKPPYIGIDSYGFRELNYLIDKSVRYGMLCIRMQRYFLNLKNVITVINKNFENQQITPTLYSVRLLVQSCRGNISALENQWKYYVLRHTKITKLLFL